MGVGAWLGFRHHHMVPRSSTGSHERIVELAENMIRMTGKIPYEEARTLRKIEKIFVSRPDQDGSARLEQLLPALARTPTRVVSPSEN